MTQSPDDFDFDDFPYENLEIYIPRRGFFTAISEEIHGFSEKSDGKAVLSMAELGAMSYRELSLIKPVIMEGCKISTNEGYVWAEPKTTIEPLKLFPIDSPALTVFNNINGKTTIQAISLALMEKTGWEEDHCKAYTRAFFLKLVQGGICRPN